MAHAPLLLAAPNVSEGRDAGAVESIGGALAPSGGPGRLLDVHSDPDHGRSVLTLAARQGDMAGALVNGARAALARIDMRRHGGRHPRVGALDVMPVVYLDDDGRGAACAEALTAAALVGEDLGVPVFLYGQLATAGERRERAALRDGGLAALAARVESKELAPDFGPSRVDTRSGAVLATARPPLVAFNLELEEGDETLARGIAAELRESGGGLAGVRAIGLDLPSRGRAQVSVNVHDPVSVPLREVVEFVRARAPVAVAEIVGLAPAAALDGFPEDLRLRGFSPERHVIERALR